MSRFEGKTAFVTGGSGLLGSFLVARLLENGMKVYSLETRKERSFDRLANCNVNRIYGDILETQGYSVAVKEADVIFHLAAKINISQSVSDPTSFYKVNTLGTASLLEEVRKNGNAKFVYCSTTNVYGKPASLIVEENHPLHPLEPYGSSKAAAEMICSAYANTYGINTVCVRPSSIYGPSQEKSQLIPKILDLAANKGKILKSKQAIYRDFVYADDVAQALILSYEKGDSGATYNIASGNPSLNVNSVIDLALEQVRKKEYTVEIADLAPKDTEREKTEFSIEKAKKELGWSPATDLKLGLRNTAKWFEKIGRMHEK